MKSVSCMKELIKVTFVGDTLGSGGNFGTCVCGAKLTVNTNNQSAGPIEHWRQSNEQQREGGREGAREEGREGGSTVQALGLRGEDC